MIDSRKRPHLQFNIRVLLMAMLVCAAFLGWWRAASKQRQVQAQLDAMLRALQAPAAPEPIVYEASAPRQLPANTCDTPEEFIIALRTISDWYEFADDTADPFVKTQIADDTIPLLLDLLGDDDPEIRTRALATLGKINRHPDVIVPAVMPLLKDDQPNVRWHAAYALAQFRRDAEIAIPALMEQMNDDESPVATFSAVMLRQIDNRIPTEERLVQLLSNPIDSNRVRAIDALAELQTPTALDALVRHYRTESDPRMRDGLARVLASLDEKRSPSTAEQDNARELPKVR